MSETYGALLRAATEQLKAASIDHPAHEARRLVLLASGLSPAALIAQEQDEAADTHREALTQLLEQRVQRRPFAHLAGAADFYGLTVKSDARALIPRADSECVVDAALALIPETAAWRIADLGTGTGALLAAILHHRPDAVGMAVVASGEASALAAENFARLQLADRIELYTGSWATWTGWQSCDLIVSNPPYIRSDTLMTLEPEVRDYDPHLALDGGPDGLVSYRELIGLAAGQMKPGAHLVLEIGYDQKDAVSGLLERHGFANLTHYKDLGGHDRGIAALKT